MSQQNNTSDSTKPLANSEPSKHSINDILDYVDVREAAPDTTKARVKNSVKAHWQTKLSNQNNTMIRNRRLFLIAASFAIITILNISLFNSPTNQLIQLQQFNGAILITPQDGEAKQGFSGQLVASGSTIKTGINGSGTILLDGIGNLRIDSQTKMTVEGNNEIFLDKGRIYFESLAFSKTSKIEIRTIHGTIENMGTQFEVSSATDKINIRVREGGVTIDSSHGNHTLYAGYQLVKDLTGTASKETISPSDESWSWVYPLAPQFELEGKNLHQFLTWISREYGLTVDYYGNLALESQSIILHGDISSLDLDSALEVVFSTTSLDYELTEKVIRVNTKKKTL